MYKFWKIKCFQNEVDAGLWGFNMRVCNNIYKIMLIFVYNLNWIIHTHKPVSYSSDFLKIVRIDSRT